MFMFCIGNEIKSQPDEQLCWLNRDLLNSTEKIGLELLEATAYNTEDLRFRTCQQKMFSSLKQLDSNV